LPDQVVTVAKGRWLVPRVADPYGLDMPAAFYQPVSPTSADRIDRFASTSATVGPWDPRLAHGSPPATLLLHAIERAHPRADARVGRIAFDFFGPVPVAELSVSTEIVRPGARIELARGRLSAGGKVAMEASAWRIATQKARVEPVLDPRSPPPLPGPQEKARFVELPFFGYGDALEWRFVDGGFQTLGPATAYARPLLPLLEGEPLSALERLMLMVDSANGISAALDPLKFMFVPVELTVNVRRAPETEWVGMHAETLIEDDGIGQTRAELFDEKGYLGMATQTLFVAARGGV